MSSDQVFEDFLDRNPLAVFSVYTHLQVKVLTDLGANIVGALDQSFGDGSLVDSEGINEVYGLFWLWVVGAFEVVRTMAGAGGCFNDSVGIDLKDLKKRLVHLRAPFAKQQLAGKSVIIGSEASIAGIDPEQRDISYQVSGNLVSVRATIDQFNRVLGGIRREHILKDLRDA